LFVDCPAYSTKRFDGVPYLDVSAALDNGTIVINVVNRHRDQPVEAEFEAEDKQFGGAYEVAEVNGPDIKSENTFGSTSVQTVRKSVNGAGRKMRYTFPPHSYTMIKGSLAAV
jgi:alpha-N-arabinofuranosidase